ncbi:hypothetical protein CRG98_021953 [Punica granatum]|uniref:Uncharacterized protein n=1 Tax=Punica granatum TaxID=22663 RepID=A0A2I0JMX4_PUNGR|nr:hypothetical protein CRG98_021953 [Punica granatum]
MGSYASSPEALIGFEPIEARGLGGIEHLEARDLGGKWPRRSECLVGPMASKGSTTSRAVRLSVPFKGSMGSMVPTFNHID